jgi:hypothetical protein
VAFVAQGVDPRDPAVAVVDAASGKLHRFRGLKPFLQIPAWSTDSRRLALAEVNAPAAVVTVATGKQHTLHRRFAEPLVWRRARLFLVGVDATTVWHSRDGATRPTLLFRLAKRHILGLAVS